MPKEAPTPFNSRSLGSAAATRPAPLLSNPAVSEIARHMLARPGLMARPLGIPSPHGYFRLCEAIATGWGTIAPILSASTLSVTTPTDDPSKTRALVPKESLDRTENRAEMRASARYVLFADVAQCYSTIYTHGLAWAVHGKAFAKDHRGDSNLLGNRLDRFVQRSQGGQTIGIPTGPDTSLVLAELVLSRVDKALQDEGLRGFRYIDDYELYFRTHQEAERGLSLLVKELAHYELQLNSQKTSIEVLPQPLQDEWVSQLRRTELRKSPVQERSDLTLLFDDAFRMAATNRGRFVVSYALGRLGSRVEAGDPLVHGENWPYLQRLLLQSCWAQPTAIQKALSLFHVAVETGLVLDRELVEGSINGLIMEHAPLSNGSEVAWALWTAAALKLHIRHAAAKRLIGHDDDLIALGVLSLIARGLIARKLDTATWRSRLTDDGLRNGHWLLSYEAAIKGWLTPPGGDHIAVHPVYDALRRLDVSFYDAKAKVPRTPPRLTVGRQSKKGPYA